MKRPAPCERDTAAAARKSLVTTSPISAGTVLREDLIACKRPGTGLPPSMKPHLLHRRAVADLPAGHLLTLEDIA
ncbi:MAG: hypothetical protein R3C19_22465 [Planctomycetaceae bacterium]